MLSTAYHFLTAAGGPLIWLYLRKRLRAGREDPVRFAERMGHASQPRPAGRLIWFHGASVGEAMSVLSLLDEIKRAFPDIHILVTTGTVTSARLMAKRLPQGVIHHYIPVDRPVFVKRFLDHWKPDLTLWLESDLWPTMLSGIRERKIPALLLNGRMSQKSFRLWHSWAKSWARELLGTFAICLSQTEVEREQFVQLGACDVRTIGNLKYAAAPLPYDEHALETLKKDIGGRPFWLLASTHPGEDEIAISAHQKLAKKNPKLLTLIAPRHPARGDQIASLATAAKLSVAQRAKNEPITRDTQIYIADTMGEMGVFYRLARIVCIGGSFVWGGHNPIEAAQLGCAILFGPQMTNFAEIASDIKSYGAAHQVRDPASLIDALDQLLNNPDAVQALAQAAYAFADDKKHVLARMMALLSPWLRGERS